ncbi:MAG: LysM peptidoglycan-binding domain-containing protein [Oligoflexales bacterium]
MSNFGNKMKDVMSDRNNQIYFGVFVVLLLAGIGAYYFFKAPSTEDSLATETTESVQEDIENAEAGNENLNEEEMTENDSSEENSLGATEAAAVDTDTDTDTAASQEEGELTEDSSSEPAEAMTEEVGDTALETVNEENEFTTESTEGQTEAEVVAETQTVSVSDNYVITKGDWLSKIAQRVYGDMHKWTLIHEMNPQIKNPHLIYPGDEIVLEARD